MMLCGSVALPILIALVATSEKRRRTFRQRLGWWRYPWEASDGIFRRPTLWIHALSVGEVIAIQPLMMRLVENTRRMRIVLSVSTYSGFQTAQKSWRSGAVDIAYFPYDTAWSTRTIANKINPMAVILTETDLWPNFLREMERRRVPVIIANLRLSPRSWRWMGLFKPLAERAFGKIEKICTQTQQDAHRLIDLGVAENRVTVTGNLKYDSPTPRIGQDTFDSLKARLRMLPEARVVVAGSTHRGEEALLLDALEPLLKEESPLLLIIAPRRPERAREVINLCRHRKLSCDLLSGLDAGKGSSAIQVVVVDTIGVLKPLYGLADIAFVGGSLVSRGGHNPLEPAAFGKPVLFGPDMSDFRHIAKLLLKEEAAQLVNDGPQLRFACTTLLGDRQLREAMGQRARNILLRHRGAVDRTLNFLGLSDGL